MNPPFESWLLAFSWTLILELPIYLLATRRQPASFGARLSVAFGLNLLTHPALWYLLPRFRPYWAWTLYAEFLVVCVEGTLLALWLRRQQAEHPWRDGLAIAALANIVSTLIGLALRQVGLAP